MGKLVLSIFLIVLGEKLFFVRVVMIVGIVVFDSRYLIIYCFYVGGIYDIVLFFVFNGEWCGFYFCFFILIIDVGVLVCFYEWGNICFLIFVVVFFVIRYSVKIFFLE